MKLKIIINKVKVTHLNHLMNQNTLKINFNRVNEQINDINVNRVLNTMIHDEKIDKYIDTLI